MVFVGRLSPEKGIDTLLDAWAVQYPDLITPKTSIGTSIEGRDIWAVKISDNPNQDEDEPEDETPPEGAVMPEEEDGADLDEDDLDEDDLDGEDPGDA